MVKAGILITLLSQKIAFAELAFFFFFLINRLLPKVIAFEIGSEIGSISPASFLSLYKEIRVEWAMFFTELSGIRSCGEQERNKNEHN